MPLTVSVELPELVIVNVAVAVLPVVTLPNARFPLTPTTRLDDGLMVSAKFWSENKLFVSSTCTVKLAVVATVGVPVIAPVPATRANPAGRLFDTTDQL